MARSITVASGSADTQAVTGSVTLLGYSIRESAAAAAVASVILRDGIAATDPERAFIELAANQSETKALPAVEFTDGIFVDRDGGETVLVLYLA